ncbi:hypothetical protein [Albidovulum sp.]
MSVKSLSSVLPDVASSVMSAPSLRIAVPSWRLVGIHPVMEEARPAETLSREEIQALFHCELNGRPHRRSDLTSREERERAIARRIRKALYPDRDEPVRH